MQTFVSGTIEELDNELTKIELTNSYSTLIRGLRDCISKYNKGYIDLVLIEIEQQLMLSINLRVKI